LGMMLSICTLHKSRELLPEIVCNALLMMVLTKIMLHAIA
jgi:hypothetical protein